MTSEFKKKLVSVEESRRFIFDCFRAANASEENANAMADLLVAAERKGFHSHGMNSLEIYIKDLLNDLTDGSSNPQIIKETPVTAWVDGRNGLGAVVGNYCMDLAIKKAKVMGIGWVVAKNSNNYGIASFYVQRALNEGMIGISATNGSPLVAPTNAKAAALGANPISFGAQGVGDKFLLDMATSTVAMGRIEMKGRRNEPIPNGWAHDPDGNITNDSKLAFKTGCLLPLGGDEAGCGYKGYGLGAMVDILTGVLAGANYSNQIRRSLQGGSNTIANLGHMFIAINPSFFASGFEERVTDFNNHLRNLPRIDPSKPVLVAGDREEANEKAIDEAGGILYVENQLMSCTALAQRLNVQPIKLVRAKNT